MAIKKSDKQWIWAIILMAIIVALIDYLVNHL